ncbi:MAG: protein-L-isoaspartate(D-aspartate) O-methyltransferase [Alphaproteobacteria bacterium]
MNDNQFDALRRQMLVEIEAHTQLVSQQTGRTAINERVLEVMARIPRHEFVPPEIMPYAYVDTPLPIGFGKTISQPFIIALMTDLLDISKDDRILEIGTGLGYQAAILAEMAKEVYSVEIIEELAKGARDRIARRGYRNVQMRQGDGYYGWAERAPFDKVICTAAPDLIPPPLLGQLKARGRMVVPAGIPDAQQLLLVERDGDGRIRTKEILPVRFSQLESGDRE